MNQEIESDDREDNGVMSKHLAVAVGTSQVVLVAFVGFLVLVAWAAALITSIVVAYLSTPGSFAQGFSINALAALVMCAIAPIVFEYLHLRSLPVLAGYLAATGLTTLAALETSGALRDFFLNLGCGLWFLFMVDFYIYKCLLPSLQKRIDDAVKNVKNSPMVL